MMNALALGLVLTSLVTAGFFNPSPEKENAKKDVIVKGGHRVVVVEYENDDGNTKVLISPHDSLISHKFSENGLAANVKDKLSEKMEDAKEKIKEASSSVLPELGKEGNQEDESHHRFSPGELVCDAYGKCKRIIASAMGKTKEAVAERAHEAADKVHTSEEAVTEAVTAAVGKVKDTASHAAHKASDKIQEAKANVKDSASEISSKAKNEAAQKASGMRESAKEQAEKVKRRVHDAVDTTKKVKEDAEREASRKMEGTKEMVSEKAEEWIENASGRVRETASKVKKEGQKELSEILRNAREVAVDVFNYMLPPERVASFMGILHLMGFAAAYGMCVWVTFASSYVLAGALPRQQFAMVQSKIYPVYFKAMAYSVGMALLGHLMMSLSQRKGLFPVSAGMFQGFNLMASLAMILANLLFLEPRASKVMLERMKKEKEEGQATEPTGRVVDSDSTAATAGRVTGGGTTTTKENQEAAAAKAEIIRLTATLQRLNSYSSFLNVLTLMSLTWHVAQLGQHLHAAC
ncbi:Transmembrane protein [Sesamum alatum]|uniref:Transmembrane protein n=1 Tax=Sesamum alatum TaxID=300844 RepID=A0AAE1XK07_9LAMI|nr:Transmembrane protein [Sesamum alatum]